MSGTSAGNKKGALTKKLRYGNEYYVHLKEIAKKGGANSTSRPFRDPEKAKAAAKKRWQNA